MDEVGIYEGKTHFAELVSRAERGERITITKRGRPVAELVPAQQRRREDSIAAWDRLMALREELRTKGVRVTHKEIKAWINEGRK